MIGGVASLNTASKHESYRYRFRCRTKVIVSVDLLRSTHSGFLPLSATRVVT